MRESNLAGLYFHGASTLLDKQIRDAFLSEKGPGELPVKPSKKEGLVKGLVVPRYKYDLAGPAMAWGYKALAESGQPDVVIIVGQGKRGVSGVGSEPYDTPYGIIRVDQKLALSLSEKGTVKENNALFDEDEFVESQLPFLQFVYKGKDSLKILPLILDLDVDLKKFVVDLKESLLELDRKATIIIPVNLTSYGRDHSYIPFSKDAHKKVYELDRGAIDFIEGKDAKGFFKYHEDKGMNTDNYLGILFALLAIKPKKVLLEQYYTTADLNHDYDNFTSFTSIVFK